MALQVSGAISLANIRGEFGGSAPDSLSEYYSAAAGIPASGTINISDFYGASAVTAPPLATATYSATYASNPTSFLIHEFASNDKYYGHGRSTGDGPSSFGVNVIGATQWPPASATNHIVMVSNAMGNGRSAVEYNRISFSDGFTSNTIGGLFVLANDYAYMSSPNFHSGDSANAAAAMKYIADVMNSNVGATTWSVTLSKV